MSLLLTAFCVLLESGGRGANAINLPFTPKTDLSRDKSGYAKFWNDWHVLIYQFMTLSAVGLRNKEVDLLWNLKNAPLNALRDLKKQRGLASLVHEFVKKLKPVAGEESDPEAKLKVANNLMAMLTVRSRLLLAQSLEYHILQGMVGHEPMSTPFYLQGTDAMPGRCAHAAMQGMDP
ncbi:hypothetical protein CYMTET_43570 [Cymbomonas tetramitiformis]|uniref:Uncharacterized protein n=1 Tax=Cymbomonas tetramitiformis TaxID=36881 RepID=A0AAE0C3K8_9CHLO|nr:hypothetical protein CYMTET_43570 [Cymbomonas tetramitiformis]